MKKNKLKKKILVFPEPNHKKLFLLIDFYQNLCWKLMHIFVLSNLKITNYRAHKFLLNLIKVF